LARACVLYPQRTLETLTSEDLVHIVASFPPKSQKRARAAFASMYRWAILWAKVDRNPMDRVPRPIQRPGRYIEVFTDAEAAALTSLELRDGALTTVLFDAGLRKGEARNLRQRHCLLERRQLVVVGGKGGKDNVIPMTHRLGTVLADLFLTDGLGPDDHLWYAFGGNQRARTIKTVEGDRRRDIPPLVGPLPGSRRRPLGSCTRPGTRRDPLAPTGRPHRDVEPGDGTRVDRNDYGPLRPSERRRPRP
jgi:integrase